MKVESPVEFEKLLKTSVFRRLGDENLVLFSERSGQSFSALKMYKKLIALIGPEGGWDDAEIELALANEVKIITLGGRILRAETAVIAISALLQNHFGDFN